MVGGPAKVVPRGRFKIDDPVQAFPVHGACGAWGVLAVGLFANKAYSYAPPEGNPLRYDASGADLGPDAGLFLPGSRGQLFGTQVVSLLIEIPCKGCRPRNSRPFCRPSRRPRG